MRRARRLALALVAALAALAVAALLFLDADRFRPWLEAAAGEALGLPVRIGAPVGIRPGLRPGLELREVVVAGADGVPAVTLARAEARIALGPLLAGRIVLAGLAAEGGELRLDPGAWRADRPGRAEGSPPGPARAPGGGPAFELREARLADWRLRRGDAMIVLRAARLQTDSGGGLRLTGEALWRDTAVTFRGQAPGPTGPWKVEATALGASARLDVRREGALWRAELLGEAPALAALAPIAGQPLPPLTGLRLAARGGFGPEGAVLEALDLRIGGGEMAGLTLLEAAAGLTAPGAPLTFSARLDGRGLPLALVGEARLPLPGGTGPVALALRAEAADGRATLEGRWPGPFELRATLPALAPLAGPLGAPLPPLRDVALEATLAVVGQTTLELPAFALRGSAGDLSGALRVQAGPRPALTGEIASRTLDLAAIRPPAAPAAPAGPPAAMPGPAAPVRVIPDLAIDLSALRRFDADLRLAVAELRDGAARYRDVTAHLVVREGRASLDPLSSRLPGGMLRLRAAADATGGAPALHVAGGGEGLDLAALLGAFGDWLPTTGRADLAFDLRGRGPTLRAVAADLTGHLGLAVTEGLLGGPLSTLLGQIAPGFAQGLPFACLAVRAEAENGLVRFPALFLDSAAGRIAGEGTLRLADETLALRLVTDLRLGGLRVRAPVPLRGTLASPRLEGQALLEGALQGPPGPMPDCARTLRLARGGREGPVPGPAPEGGAEAPALPPAVNQLLRGLLGR